MPSHCSVRLCSDRVKQLLLLCFSFCFTNCFTSNAMMSVWQTSTSVAATEHDTERLIQSVANIIFVNIDWKRSRHDTAVSTERNLRQLAATTTGIVENMQPAVICCCEAGHPMDPMSREQMDAMKESMRAAWEVAATEHPDIHLIFE